jgi:hypothetical protein
MAPHAIDALHHGPFSHGEADQFIRPVQTARLEAWIPTGRSLPPTFTHGPSWFCFLSALSRILSGFMPFLPNFLVLEEADLCHITDPVFDVLRLSSELLSHVQDNPRTSTTSVNGSCLDATPTGIHVLVDGILVRLRTAAGLDQRVVQFVSTQPMPVERGTLNTPGGPSTTPHPLYRIANCPPPLRWKEGPPRREDFDDEATTPQPPHRIANSPPPLRWKEGPPRREDFDGEVEPGGGGGSSTTP